MRGQAKRIYEFGPFRLHEREGVLLRDDRPVPLTPKVFEMLLLLVENRGHLVLKEEIMSRLWPNSFVEEVNVNRNISTLRRALADSPNDPVYIETAPKRGYRFVASVVEVEMDEADLILERRTSAQIITEEEEEIADAGQSIRDEAFAGTAPVARPAAHPRLISRLRRHALPLSAVVMLALFAAVVYLWVLGQHGRAATGVKVKSIAVLPFRNLSASGDDEHLGLGLADVLITRLSNLKAVNVRPTSAVLKYDQQDSVEAGRTLGVDAVLEGSIQHSGDRIRVTARLVKVSDQSPIWSGQFDEKAEDLLAVQDTISQQLVYSLALDLSGSEKARLAKHYTDDADAYQLYVKGRYHWNKRNWTGMDQAQYFFRRAIEKDPNFALAYVGLADSMFTGSASPEAYTSVKKAIELDGTLGEAYATRGFASMFHEWDWRGAEENFKRAIELNPGYGTAHQWYASLLAIRGRVDEAKREMSRALDIDPTSHNFLADTGQLHYFAREYQEAENYCRKALAVSADFEFAHWYLFDTYLKSGRDDDAFEQYLELFTTHSDANRSDEQMNHEIRLRAKYLQSGIRSILRDIIDSDLRARNPGYQLARLYVLLGEKERALPWLERSYENKDFMLPFVNVDPVFDDLRSEPRFQAVLSRLGLGS